MDTSLIKSMKGTLKYWYLPLLAGLIFMIVSVVVFTSPLSSFGVLAILFSLSFLFGGIAEIIFSIANRKLMVNWGWSLAFGLITFAVGILLLMNTVLSMAVLAYYVGFTILFRSIAAMSFAIDLKKYGSKNWGGLLALGILGAITSFVLIWNPLFAGISAVFLVALSFLFAGLFSIFFSMQLRKLHKLSRKLPTERKGGGFDTLADEIHEELYS